ncbi:MAG: ribonuclease III, partial [Proteobacteria bacterium]|nr:ribonuclease III [Pseudomonadota bacterium]
MLSQRQQTLCTKLEISFNNTDLLIQALSHRSIGANNNERLEYLGDAILSFIIADALYSKFPQAKEGKLSRLRALLVKGVT